MNELGDAAVDEGSQRVTWRNRMASMACIGLVWLMVRLVAELNGTGWERAFWSVSVNFGAYVATLSLAFAFVARSRRDQAWHRGMSFVSVLFSLVVFAICGDEPQEGVKAFYGLKLTSQLIFVTVLFLLYRKRLQKVI